MKSSKIVKDDKLIYRSGIGNLYSAYVLRAHRDGTWTVQLYFNLDKKGREIPCFQGDKFRIDHRNIVSRF